MEALFKALQQPEYVHVLLNHLPIIGLATGLLVLLIAFFQKSRSTASAAFGVIFLMSLSVIPVSEFGEKAVDQVEGLMDKTGRSWLNEHGSRADRIEWLYFATAAAAFGGLLAPRFLPKCTPFFLWGTLLIGSAALAGGIWTASAGGKIMHREFRYTLPIAEDRT